nr:nuclear pore complex protein NUP205 [Ipomoea batatas]
MSGVEQLSKGQTNISHTSDSDPHVVRCYVDVGYDPNSGKATFDRRSPPSPSALAFFYLRSPPSHSLAERSPVAVRAGRPSFAVVSSVAFAHRPRRSPFAQDGFPLESMQRVCTLEAELALLLRISYKYRKSGAQVLFSMDALEHISSCKALKMQIKGSHHRFETKFGRELSVDVDKQRMVIAPILRLVFSFTSLVDTSEFFQVSNKVVRGVLEFIRGHALLFDQIVREDLSGADELTMEQVNLVVSILTKIWPYEESDDYGFVQGLFTMMRVIFSLDLDSFISNKSMCYIESAKLDFLHKKVLDTKGDGIFSSGRGNPIKL